jgi:hypothetical protein
VSSEIGTPEIPLMASISGTTRSDLLVQAYGGTVSERHAADIDDIGPVAHGGDRRTEGLVEGKRGALVEEGIRRAVDDRHHRDFPREIEDARPDAPACVKDFAVCPKVDFIDRQQCWMRHSTLLADLVYAPAPPFDFALTPRVLPARRATSSIA